MTESNTDKHIGKINETLTEIRIDSAKNEERLKTTNESVKTLCGKLDKYVEATERRLGSIEDDIGDKGPDDPTVFAQLQTLSAYKKRTSANAKAVWAFIGSLVLLGISQVTSFFGKGD